MDYLELFLENIYFNEEYERPYSMKEIKKNYGKEYYNKLKNDPVHRWRAETGIELIHKEPSKEELERIMKNWELMDKKRKRISDKKSMEIFGCNNRDNYNNLLNNYKESYIINEDIGSQEYVIENILLKTPYEKIFVASDWHLFKKEVTGIPEKESNFNLNKYILKHNLKVRNNDVFIYLGDLAHRKCGQEHYMKLRNFVNKLNGIKILIKGNHDKESDDYYLSCGFNFVFETLQFKNILFSHRPKDLREFPGVKYNIHGHLHEYKVYRTGINPKNHIGIYSKNHDVLSLKYIMDHRKEIESENIDIYKQYDKPLNDYKNDVNRYIKICKKFFKTNPEYLNMSKEERYFKQEEMIRKFLKMQEVQSDEGLIGWIQTKMDNIKDFNKLSYKPVGINDYCHFVILNKDSNLIIDLNPDLIDWDEQYVYSHGKNMIKFKWSICKIIYYWDSKETGGIPQTQWLQIIKDRKLK